MNKEENELFSDTFSLLFKSTTAVLLFIVITTTIYYKYCAPYWENLQTANIQQSHVVVTAKRELLIKLKADFDKLETQKVEHRSDLELIDVYTAQQKSIVARMRLEAATMQTADVPVELRNIVF